MNATVGPANPPDYSNYAEWLLGGHCAPVVVEHRLPAGSAGVGLFFTRQNEAFPDPPTPDLCLQLVTAGRAEMTFDLGHGRYSGVHTSGMFAVSPPHVPADYRGHGPFELMAVSVPWAAVGPRLSEAVGRDVPDLGPLHARTNRCGVVERLVHCMWEEAADGGPGGGLFAEHAAHALCLRLLRLAGRAVPEPGRRDRLAPAALRRSLDLLHASVEGGVTLADLAAAAGENVFRFARLFRASTGEPPHQYLIRLRVERAKELLRSHPHLTVAAVAARCGFCDQTHLARHFRRLVGTTPAAYRAG